ncbi:MAG: hypothetical protein WC955_06385 [Elusimicrobiota bacterium]
MKKNLYRSSYEHLEDYFGYIDLWFRYAKNTDYGRTSSNENAQHLAEIRQKESGIDEKTKNSVRLKKWLALEYIAKEYKLDDTEKFILGLAVYMDVFGGSKWRPVTRINGMIQLLALRNGEPESYVKYVRYFSFQSRLFKLSGYLGNDLVVKDGRIIELVKRDKSPEVGNEAGGRINQRCIKKLGSPKQLYRELDKYVVGQDEVKRRLSVAVFNHLQKNRVSSVKKIIRK